jgi:hypothetical protein
VAQRSPHNPRYQKDSKVGKTRKSAAAAKPKRGAGERGPSPDKGKDGKKSRMEVVSTPEIKALRKRWWIFMGIALASATMLLVPLVQESRALTSVAMGAWGASFATAVYIDWVKIRKLRKEEIEKRKKDKK